MDLKTLITGTAGFIGFHLANKLLQEGYDVVGLDNINDYYDVNLKYDRLKESGIDKAAILKAEKNSQIENKVVQSSRFNNYRFIKLDLSDGNSLNELFKREKFDLVVNLAAQAGVRYSLENPQAYIDSNVTGFLNILEACRKYPLRHLLYASSSSVYGSNKKIPFSEDDRTDNPISMYAVTKKSNELMAHTYSHLFGIPSTGLRFFTVYGPWGRPDMALFIFTKAIFDNEPIKVFNYGKMKRDFTYIDDIIKGLSGLIEKISRNEETKGNSESRIFNIGNHQSVELMTMISMLENKTGRKAKLELLPIPAGDVENTYADISKLNSAGITLNHRNLEYGIEEFINWYKAYYNLK
ncbi:MAG: NAD-dependent epimerase/dehydratase family protein [Ignavibacteriaceae bacterium]|nr:NAD-dependent epimerase/dehydratase family protein [Ignavibacteriaceae bacterium]